MSRFDIDNGDLWGFLPPGAGNPGRGWRYWLSAVVVGLVFGAVISAAIWG